MKPALRGNPTVTKEKDMRPDTRFCVTAHLSNGTTLTCYSNSIAAIGAWKEGVSETAAAFSHKVVEFVFVQNNAPTWEYA